MGRREKELVSNGDPTVELAIWIREQRQRVGLTYEQLASQLGCHKSTVSRAASGKWLPSLQLVVEIAHQCQADLRKARTMWRRAFRERYVRRLLAADAGGFRPPHPELVITAAELRVAMQLLLARSGKTLRQVEAVSRDLQRVRGGGDTISRSTLHNVLTGRSRPTKRVLIALLDACNVPDADRQVWEAAWQRAGRELLLESWLDGSPAVRQAARNTGDRLPRLRGVPGDLD